MFNHIPVPLDRSSLAECVLPHAIAVARIFRSKVTLLRVLEKTHSADWAEPIDLLSWQIGKSEATAYLKGVTARLRSNGLNAEVALLEGQSAASIIQFARINNVDLIILSSHGQSGLSGWNVSSVVQKVILRAYMPVMIVRAYQQTSFESAGVRYHRLFVPLDCSQRAECVVPIATAIAHAHESLLFLAHVVHIPEIPHRGPLSQENINLAKQVTKRSRSEALRYLEQLQSQMSSETFESCTHVVVSSNIAAKLHEIAEEKEVDLVVLSAHGYSQTSRWPYGSAAISFIAYGTTPLLIMQNVHPEEVILTQAELANGEHFGH